MSQLGLFEPLLASPHNLVLPQTGLSVARTLPLAPVAERRYVEQTR